MSKIVLYDDIETAPFERYRKFNNYMAMAAETGENWEDLTTRVKRCNGYIASGDKQSAIKENSNMLMAFSFIKNEFSPSGMAFACMVKSIDGVSYENADVSENGLSLILKECSKHGVSFKDIKTDTERVKKKSLMSCVYFLKKRLVG